MIFFCFQLQPCTLTSPQINVPVSPNVTSLVRQASNRRQTDVISANVNQVYIKVLVFFTTIKVAILNPILNNVKLEISLMHQVVSVHNDTRNLIVVHGYCTLQVHSKWCMTCT
jgi:hypothetical protein